MEDSPPSSSRHHAEPGQPGGLDFPVVGLGASAGGLVALGRLFENMPADCGMAFVVILHLSPKHESSADQILQRSTRMPVMQVTQTQRIQANHVYVISPRKELLMQDGELRVMDADSVRGQHAAIDLFFRTLADAHDDRSIGIVMSGNGSDGSVGLARLKEQGGVAIAQLPDDCEYDAMPRAAIATGKVDFVLPAIEIPQKLMDLWQNARRIRMPRDEADPKIAVRRTNSEEAEKALHDIVDLLANRTGHDFRHYKRATVLRRIERRLQVNLLRDLPAYLEYLRKNVEETADLLDDMLIGVTNFFRDREAFEGLERQIIPELFVDRPPTDQLRIWVAGCSTGEEAYSIAMLLADEAEHQARLPAFQVFASDIDERAIAVGRNGCYPESIVADVPPQRLRQYFSKEQNHYRIRKSIRDKVLFALHNVLRDPPFSRVDMICCRNLLIYLNRDIQMRLLEMFHFALMPGGVLFLGSSESADAAGSRFEPIDKRLRIYRAKAQARGLRHPPELPLRVSPAVSRTLLPSGAPSPRERGFSFAEVHQRILEQYAPPSVIVDREYTIVHMSDQAGRFLRFAAGEPSHDLVTVVLPALRLELRSALFQATSTNKSVEARRVLVEHEGRVSYVNMVARPFRDVEACADFILVLFDEVEDTMSVDASSVVGKDTVLVRLEEELHATKERLQSTIEQSETSNEELKASNEELQAINEELRSATEELETSKEELQSVNEELITVNFELKSKMEETAKINDDLQNFIASTEIATVFVGGDLRIKRYTPRAEDLFNIIPSDVGRCILDITHRLAYPDLAADAKAAFETLRLIEREVRSRDGSWFVARALPYRTAENKIDGAVLTFVNITTLRRTEERLRVGESQINQMSTNVGDHAIISLDADGLVVAWNPAAENLFGYTATEMAGAPLDRIFMPEDQSRGLPGKDFRAANAHGRTESERWFLRKDGTHRYCRSAVTRLDATQLVGYAMVVRDITARARRDEESDLAERRERQLLEQSESASALKDEFLAVMSHELKHPLNLISVNAEVMARLPELQNAQRAQRALTTIRRAVQSQTMIINDLLDLSRMRTGKLALNFSTVDLVATVRGIAEVARADVATANLTVEYEEPPYDVLIRADSTRVDQVVWNLLSNAIKFTPAGGTIQLQVSKDHRHGRLDVHDTGQGIDPQFLPRIFDMFGQASARAASEQSGLGIGLALVKQLMEHHGGRVEATSPGIGRGTTLSLWFPLISSKLMPPPSMEAQVNAQLDGLDILIVDDTKDTLDAVSSLLQLEGAKVTVADSGARALELVKSHNFDLMLSDVGMPEMDGYALMRELRRNSAVDGMKTIALTGYGRNSDVEKALQAGFDAHVSKPLSMPKLVAAISSIMEERRH
ncbi:CheR family methyltransferase [Tahibacter amnicola]|uniref:PAS domain-containing protein n=1 Tax=Tahibacter amnicola TaxID=2976241 RepID=A0ABY6BGG6_9GAMM|nr:CheR family methyltransferase [Tahibacter amnicola]UXI68925.1 PAS domain-containing protein [Tahibacter amnicola]